MTRENLAKRMPALAQPMGYRMVFPWHAGTRSSSHNLFPLRPLKAGPVDEGDFSNSSNGRKRLSSDDFVF